MGLAWTPLAQTMGTPWWQSLAEENAWTEPLFAFYLTRCRIGYSLHRLHESNVALQILECINCPGH